MVKGILDTSPISEFRWPQEINGYLVDFLQVTSDDVSELRTCQSDTALGFRVADKKQHIFQHFQWEIVQA